jgi:predicted AAA+ superfamily ATPase
MSIARTLRDAAQARAAQLPLLAILGPRQSGKSTLCAQAFAHKPLVSLESIEAREQALGDPVGFLARFPTGAVIDEAQRAPSLFSELQIDVDRRSEPGRWVLTGSQHFHLLSSISQSLAGRIALLTLLPLSLEELGPACAADPLDACVIGGYPRIFDQRLDPTVWLDDYITTYVERDVRSVLNVGNLGTFQTFLGLCAARAGQLLNSSALGADAGVNSKTARAWISVLEAGFIVFQLRPYFRDVGKRLTKSSKLYFHDTGLLCRLLGIKSAEQLRQHPLRGSIFENLIVSEIHKSRLHRGVKPELYFYRDQSGREVDLLADDPLDPTLIEIKLTRTVMAESVRPLDDVARVLAGAEIPPRSVRRVLVHGGEETSEIAGVERAPWRGVHRILT